MRAADRLITAADKDASVSIRDDIDLVDLIINAGRPVLVVGAAIDKRDLRSVLVCWKDTRESHRAIADALPILKLADRVTVVEVAAKDDLDHARQRAGDVAAWLAGQGIAVIARVAAATDDDSTEIGNMAKELDAGLLVGGA